MTLEFVFVHGGGQGGWTWDELIAEVRRQAGGARVKALALDVPGCGAKRGRDVAGLDIPEVVAELGGEIDAAGFEAPVIVGHSMAGTLLPWLVAERPGVFKRAVYVACCAPKPGQSVAQMMGTGRQGENPDEVGYPTSRAPTAVMGRLQAMFCNDMSAAQRRAFLRKIGKDNWPPACREARLDWPHAAAAQTPTRYVAALRDGSLPLAWQMRFAERLGARETVRLDGGHQLMQTQTAALAGVLLN